MGELGCFQIPGRSDLNQQLPDRGENPLRLGIVQTVTVGNRDNGAIPHILMTDTALKVVNYPFAQRPIGDFQAHDPERFAQSMQHREAAGEHLRGPAPVAAAVREQHDGAALGGLCPVSSVQRSRTRNRPNASG